jgi:hypothetical protein
MTVGSRTWTWREWADWAINTAYLRFSYSMPLLVTLSVTVLAIRLRPPRPRLARLMREPGIVAMVAVSTMAAVWVPSLAIMPGRKPLDPISFRQIYMSMPTSVASAVAASWATLLVGGRWRADPGWCDRLGRLLGLVWLVPLLLWVCVCLL